MTNNKISMAMKKNLIAINMGSMIINKLSKAMPVEMVYWSLKVTDVTSMTDNYWPLAGFNLNWQWSVTVINDYLERIIGMCQWSFIGRQLQKHGVENHWQININKWSMTTDRSLMISDFLPGLCWTSSESYRLSVVLDIMCLTIDRLLMNIDIVRSEIALKMVKSLWLVVIVHWELVLLLENK